MRLAWLALVLAGCSAPVASVGSVEEAIIGGDVDDSDTSVFLIQAHVPGASVAHLCSGSLVSPHVVLTAAHCVDPATVGAGATFIVFDGTTASPSSPPTQFHAAQAGVFDPQFNPDKNVFPTAGHDIGAVILKNPLTLPPLRYNHAPVATALIGQPARIVGYGVTSGSDTNAMSAGTRRSAPTKLSGVNDVLLGFEDGAHNICEGDSGGPAFMTVAGVTTIVGVTAFGDATCNVGTPGSDTRVDTWAAQVDAWVTQYDPPRTTGLALGAACATDLDCGSKICAQVAGTSFCTESCSPGASMSCPGTLSCAVLDEDPLCVPVDLVAKLPHPGCAMAATSSPSSSLPLTLLLLAIVLRRRSVV